MIRAVQGDMPAPVYTEKTECQDCYKCLRACPLKSIGVSGGAATILLGECVYCGLCTKVCPSKAKRIRNDLDRVKAMLNGSKPVYLSLAPAVAADFAGTPPEAIAGAMRKLGFAGVSETAHGADMVSRSVIRQISKEYPARKLFISTACPAIVRLIERHLPAFVPYLIDSASPLHAHAAYLKAQFGDIRVVFAGPCAAKKLESDRYPDVIQAAVGFTELTAWLAENGIDLTAFPEAERVPMTLGRPSKGLLYPFDSGMCRSVESLADEGDVTPQYMSVSGLSAVERALSGFDPASLTRPLFLELLACEGGCVNGPMMRRSGSLLTKQIEVEHHAAQYGVEKPVVAADAACLGWNAEPVEKIFVSAEQMTHGLRSVGKQHPEDELNCSGCGYDSCRDFARALALGKAEKTMCVSYMRNLAQKKASGLMNSMPSGVAIVNAEMTVVECNYPFAKILGPETENLYKVCPGLGDAQIESLFPGLSDYIEAVLTDREVNHVFRTLKLGNQIINARVFVIEKGVLAGVIIFDCTVPHIQRDRIIEQARKVIESNLTTVQNIAFLLGENAAESEVILNSMIETFGSDNPQEEQS